PPTPASPLALPDALPILHALEDRASPKPGETLAVLGAAGGTGLAACELGKLMGLKVIACASSDEKLAFAKQHGAELTLNYAKEEDRKSTRLNSSHVSISY